MIRIVCLVLSMAVLVLPLTAQEAEPRPFRLGFTTFPYDISVEAVDFTYAAIARDADLIMHHYDNGVPWPEALADAPFPAGLEAEWADAVRRTPPDHAVLLSITPINWNRDGLASLRADQGDQPLPPEWESRAFDDPDVITAYGHYVLRAVETFDPDYLAIGIEVNLLLTERPDLWDGYLVLQAATYEAVKAAYPDMVVFASVLGAAYIDGISDHDAAFQRAALPGILASSDLLAFSLYPYMTAYMTGELPDSFFEQLFSLSDKPIAISETGFLAQTLEVAGMTFESSPERQAAYIAQVLDEAQTHNLVFVVNFVLRDYDALWEKIGGGDVASVWRDTGLYDEAGGVRPALDLWRAALGRPYEP